MQVDQTAYWFIIVSMQSNEFQSPNDNQLAGIVWCTSIHNASYRCACSIDIDHRSQPLNPQSINCPVSTTKATTCVCGRYPVNREILYHKTCRDSVEMIPTLEQTVEQSSNCLRPYLKTLPLVLRWLHFKQSAKWCSRNLCSTCQRGVQELSFNFKFDKMKSKRLPNGKIGRVEFVKTAKSAKRTAAFSYTSTR